MKDEVEATLEEQQRRVVYHCLVDSMHEGQLSQAARSKSVAVIIDNSLKTTGARTLDGYGPLEVTFVFHYRLQLQLRPIQTDVIYQHCA